MFTERNFCKLSYILQHTLSLSALHSESCY